MMTRLKRAGCLRLKSPCGRPRERAPAVAVYVPGGEAKTVMSGDRSRFELQPTLEGTLVRLRPLHPDDFDALYGVAKDPLIWEQHPARDRYKEETFREFFREALASRGALL